MFALTFVAPAIACVTILGAYLATRAKDMSAVSLRLAAEEIQAEEENARWSEALVRRSDMNRTRKGF